MLHSGNVLRCSLPLLPPPGAHMYIYFFFSGSYILEGWNCHWVTCHLMSEPEPSQATGMFMICCILGKFLGVVCHCFPPRAHMYIYIFFFRQLHFRGMKWPLSNLSFDVSKKAWIWSNCFVTKWRVLAKLSVTSICLENNLERYKIKILFF